MKFSNNSNQGSVTIESLAYLVAFATALLLIEPCLRPDTVSSHVSAAQIIKRRRLQPSEADEFNYDCALDHEPQYEDVSCEQSLSQSIAEGVSVVPNGVQEVSHTGHSGRTIWSKWLKIIFVYGILGGAVLATSLGLYFSKTAEWGFGLGITTTVLLLVFLVHMFDLASSEKKQIGLGVSIATVGLLGPSITLAATGKEAFGIDWGWAPMGYCFSLLGTVIFILVTVGIYKCAHNNESGKDYRGGSFGLGIFTAIITGIGGVTFTNAATGIHGWGLCFLTSGVLLTVVTIWISTIVINQIKPDRRCGHHFMASATAVCAGGALSSGLLKINGTLTQTALFCQESCPVLDVIFPLCVAMGGCFLAFWIALALYQKCGCRKTGMHVKGPEVQAEL